MSVLAFLVKNSQAVAGISLAAIFTGSMYSQTLGLNRYRRVVAQYKDGEEQPLDEDTAQLAEKVMMTVKLTAEEEASLDFFMVYGQDTCHRGSLKLRTGGLVGIPATFAYQSTDQVQKDQIQINNAPVNWDSRGGELLLNSIVLSRKAKAFAIGREIEYANTHHVWVEGFMKIGFMFSAYALGFFLNVTFQLKRVMKRWARGSMYGVIGASALILYFLIDDTYYCYRDHGVDKRVSKLGQEYAEGGLEYYSKLLQRNMALRLLLGSEGERIYTMYGNTQASWRRPHAMLTERRDYFVNYLKELKDKDVKDDAKETS